MIYQRNQRFQMQSSNKRRKMRIKKRKKIKWKKNKVINQK
jgi:hypothetical protein